MGHKRGGCNVIEIWEFGDQLLGMIHYFGRQDDRNTHETHGVSRGVQGFVHHFFGETLDIKDKLPNEVLQLDNQRVVEWYTFKPIYHSQDKHHISVFDSHHGWDGFCVHGGNFLGCTL